MEQGSFGVEMRSGGHTFQINFSNGFGTTLGQIARGGVGSDLLERRLGLRGVTEGGVRARR